MIRALAAHAGHIGGMVVSPRATLLGMLAAPPRMEALIPWLCLCQATIEPVRVGQCLLIARSAPLDGLLLFLGAVGTRFGPIIIGAFVTGALAWALGGKKRGLSFDVLSSIAAFAAVPHFLLASLGAALEVLGADLWFMPQHPLLGPAWVIGVRATVAYGWSLGLGLLYLRLVRPR